jgi:holo-[acyl-carrier protein] synthase
MIIGVGVDIVNIKRFKKIVKNNPKILDRILTERELKLFKNYKDPLIHYAGRFSLKESIIKAGKDYLNIKSYKDIEILKDNEGNLVLIKPKGKIFISLSHDGDYIVSMAIIERND